MNKSKEKLERSLGMKLFLKAERCNSPKCAMVRHPQRPGMHGAKHKRAKTEYGDQLLEKQRIKVNYGLGEKQLAKIIKESMKKTGSIAEALISALECQLSNVVFRLGFANSRAIARQLISHGHFFINNRKVTIPSYFVKIGQNISIKPSSMELLLFKNLSDKLKKYDSPEWLNLDKEKLSGKITSLPKEIDMPFDINLVVDYYSR